LYTAETHTHSLGDLDACLYGNSQTGFNLMGQAQPPMLAGPPCLVQNAAAPHSPAMHRQRTHVTINKMPTHHHLHLQSTHLTKIVWTATVPHPLTPQFCVHRHP